MRNKQVYSANTLDLLKVEINNLKEKRKTLLSLEQVLLQHRKDIIELIKLGCTAKEIANTFKAAQVKVGIAKIKQLYFINKIANKVNNKHKMIKSSDHKSTQSK